MAWPRNPDICESKKKKKLLGIKTLRITKYTPWDFPKSGILSYISIHDLTPLLPTWPNFYEHFLKKNAATF